MVVSGPVMSQDAHAPGYAVVGGPGGPDAPGYAVVGEALVGAEPVPVGVSKMRTNGAMDPRMAAMGGRPGCRPGRSVGRSDQFAAGADRRWRHRPRIGRTSSATSSVCRCSARTGASEKKKNAISTPRSPTARMTAGHGIACLSRLWQGQPLTHDSHPAQASTAKHWKHPAGIKAALG